jgi:hypothetical protein
VTNFQSDPEPPSAQPARQFDQTVGKLETRPSTSQARHWVRWVLEEIGMPEEEIKGGTKGKRIGLPSVGQIAHERLRSIGARFNVNKDIRHGWDFFPRAL